MLPASVVVVDAGAMVVVRGPEKKNQLKFRLVNCNIEDKTTCACICKITFVPPHLTPAPSPDPQLSFGLWGHWLISVSRPVHRTSSIMNTDETLPNLKHGTRVLQLQPNVYTSSCGVKKASPSKDPVAFLLTQTSWLAFQL